MNGATLPQLSSTRIQFINHANYKINWFKCDGLRKRHKNIDSLICAKRYFPPWRAWAVLRQFRDREWRGIESHCWHRTAWWKCVFRVSWILNINAWDANCLFATNALCLKKTRTLRNGQPVKALHTARLETGTYREPRWVYRSSTVSRHFASKS